MNDEQSVSPAQVKYGRGQNPNSKRNLKPFKPGEVPHTIHTGPMITPALRRFAAMPLPVVKELVKQPESLNVAEAIALTALMDALTTGSFSTGAKSRELVFNRVDGDEGKSGINIEQAVVVVREYVGNGDS